jgi:phosphoglycerol transferase MdoB-like AlkP superfamily enzyme
MVLIPHGTLGFSFLLGALTLALLWRNARRPKSPASVRWLLVGATVLFAASFALSVIKTLGGRP